MRITSRRLALQLSRDTRGSMNNRRWMPVVMRYVACRSLASCICILASSVSISCTCTALHPLIVFVCAALVAVQHDLPRRVHTGGKCVGISQKAHELYTTFTHRGLKDTPFSRRHHCLHRNHLDRMKLCHSGPLL